MHLERTITLFIIWFGFEFEWNFHECKRERERERVGKIDSGWIYITASNGYFTQFSNVSHFYENFVYKFTVIPILSSVAHKQSNKSVRMSTKKELHVTIIHTQHKPQNNFKSNDTHTHTHKNKIRPQLKLSYFNKTNLI